MLANVYIVHLTLLLLKSKEKLCLYAFLKHAHVVTLSQKSPESICVFRLPNSSHTQKVKKSMLIHFFIHSDANPSVKRTGEGVRWQCVFKCCSSQCSNAAKTCRSGKLSAQTIKPVKKMIRASCHIHRHYDWTNAKQSIGKKSHTCCMTSEYLPSLSISVMEGIDYW